MWLWSFLWTSGLIWALKRENCTWMWCWVTVTTLCHWVRRSFLVTLKLPMVEFFLLYELSAKPLKMLDWISTQYSSVKHWSCMMLRKSIFSLWWLQLYVLCVFQTTTSSLKMTSQAIVWLRNSWGTFNWGCLYQWFSMQGEEDFVPLGHLAVAGDIFGGHK